MRNTVLVLVGPTAVGKTGVSIELAQLLDAEIVSADSVSIYKKLDIGSAKPTAQEQAKAIFHLIDVVEPDVPFSAGDFQKLSQEIITDILNRNRAAIVVGGSGLYVKSAIDGLNLSLPGENTALRKRLHDMSAWRGVEHVHRLLQKIDAKSAENIPAGNLKRVIRAIEISLGAGRPASELFAEDSNRPSAFPNAVFIGLTLPRDLLYQRIDMRVEAMIEQGFVQEVEQLINEGIPLEALSMQSLGYKEIVSFLKGELSLAEAVEEIKRNTRRFAKRQYTWFKADKRIRWVDVESLTTRQVAVMVKESLS